MLRILSGRTCQIVAVVVLRSPMICARFTGNRFCLPHVIQKAKGSEPASFSDFSTDQFYLTEGRHRRSRERRSCMALDRERMMELRRAQVLQQLSISCCAVHMRRQRYGRFCTSHHIGLRLSEENLHLLALLLRLPSAFSWLRKAAVQMLPRGPPPPEWQERQ